MKVLLLDDLESSLVEMIQSVSEEVEVVRVEGEEALLAVLPEIEVVMGVLGREAFGRAARLRWMHSAGAGVDGVLHPELVASDVLLTSAKGHVGEHLAEHAMGLLLALTRGIAHSVRACDWDEKLSIRNASWELTGRTMGIVGLGGTGRGVARRAAAFGMRVIAVDPDPVEVPPAVETCREMDFLYELLSEADVVTICAPLTPATEGLFDADAFDRMQSHALLINVTRGRIVEESALLQALEKGGIGGAGLDVTPVEPLPADHPLWKMPNVVITPHTAGASPLRNRRNTELLCENLRRFLAGEPLVCLIDKTKGY